MLLSAAVVSAAAPRGFLPAQFVLSLDGKTVGILASAEGGTLVGEVVSRHEESPIAKKHLVNTAHEDLEIQLGLDAERPIYDWVDATWTGNGQFRQGALTQCARDGSTLGARQFGASLSEVTFPELSVASKARGLLTLRLKPESFNPSKDAAACSKVSASQKKHWLGGFRFELDGVDSSGVTRVESFTVSTAAVTATVGQPRDAALKGNSVTFPNLKLTVAVNKAAEFEKWFVDFVVNGNSDDKHEKSGAIVLEDAAQKELARVTLGHVGIRRFSLKNDNADQTPASYAVELYVESMRLSMDGTKPSQREFATQTAPTKPRPAPALKKHKK
jgi:hypothetical protein